MTRRRWTITAATLSALAMLALSPVRSDEPSPLRDSVRQLASFARPDGGSHQQTSTALRDLGKHLFFDPRLSASGGSSCATCHPPENGWSGLTPKAVGDAGQELAYRSPTLLAASRFPRLGWGGRFRDMADVSLFALTARTNMSADLDRLGAYLRTDPSYQAEYAAAFGSTQPSTRQAVGEALVAFISTIEAPRSRFDRWVEGDDRALSAAERRGFDLFVGKARCSSCHSGPDLSDGAFHDIGLPDQDLGRGKSFPSSQALQHAFKTPTLRDVSARSPYMHDGSLTTLKDVVAFYNSGGLARQSRVPAAEPLGLSADERSDLVAFLTCLSPAAPEGKL